MSAGSALAKATGRIAKPTRPAIARPAWTVRKAPLLIDHTNAVAEGAAARADILKNPDFSYIAFIAGLWHDLGKWNPDWQAYALSLCGLTPSQMKGIAGPNHSIVGAIHAHKTHPLGVDFTGLAAVCYAIAGHHGRGLPNMVDTQNPQSSLQERMRDPQGLYAATLAGNPPAEVLTPLHLPVPPRPAYLEPTLFVRMILSCLVDADRVHSEQSIDPEITALRGRYPDLPELLNRLITYRNKKFKRKNAKKSVLNTERENLWDDCVRSASRLPGLFTLTGGLGLGKTLSGGGGFCLHHAIAHGKRRVIFVTPFITITEQVAKQFREVFGKDAVLEHHSSVRDPRDSEQPWYIPSAAKLGRENWDAPFIVTTLHQLLESLFAANSSRVRKLHNIIDSVIFIDEAQALPDDLLKPTVEMLNELMKNYGVTIVLSTATQPNLSPKPWHGFAGITAGREIVRNPKNVIQRTKRVNTHIMPLGNNVGWDDIADELRKEHTAMCVVNTRKGAVELFRRLDTPGRFRQAFHLSAGMCARHRVAVLDDIRKKLLNKKRRTPLRLVSTSLIEAGVDIDFPVVYRAVGPLDSIVQASGRCNREAALPGLGKFVVFQSDERWVPGLIGDHTVSWRKLFSTQNPDELYYPKTFEEYFDAVYANNNVDLDKGRVLRTEMKRGFPNFREIERKYKLIDSDQVTIIVPYGQEGRDAINAFIQAEAGVKVGGNLFEMLQGLTVTAFRKEAQPLIDLRILEHLPKFDLYYPVDPSRYDPIYGIDLTPPPPPQPTQP